MSTDEIRAILTISLLAAYADDHKHDREREQIREVAQGLAQDSQVNLPGLYQDVLMRRVQLGDVLPKLTSVESRRLAYEMAVCVCEADGQTSAKERAFLDGLRAALGQAPGDFVAQVDALAIMNGAIELLPENLSTLAIIPLQMRLVYQIGQSYGYELDSGHIKDLLATLGVGLTSQYLEQAGRKLLGGLLGKVGGGLFGGLGRQAVSSGMSFAATYALGHVANQYYAAGRTLDTRMLRDAYQRVMADGRQLQAKYLPQMQETAGGLDTARIMQMVRGG